MSDDPSRKTDLVEVILSDGVVWGEEEMVPRSERYRLMDLILQGGDIWLGCDLWSQGAGVFSAPIIFTSVSEGRGAGIFQSGAGYIRLSGLRSGEGCGSSIGETVHTDTGMSCTLVRGREYFWGSDGCDGSNYPRQ